MCVNVINNYTYAKIERSAQTSYTYYIFMYFHTYVVIRANVHSTKVSTGLVSFYNFTILYTHMYCMTNIFIAYVCIFLSIF